MPRLAVPSRLTGDAGAGRAAATARAATVAVLLAAAALVTAYLRVSNRVGLVVLGGPLRWLGPAFGDRQFYRIVEMMLQARYESFVTPDISRIPRTALSPGTLVVVFSPLLDQRAFTALTGLRGFPVIVVDALREEPPAEPPVVTAGFALRLWRLDRAAIRAALGDLGVAVLRWDSGTELDGVLAPRRPPGGPTMNRPSLLNGVTVTSGLITVTWASSWSYVTANLGAAAVLAAAILRWRRGSGLAAAAAIVSCAISGAGVGRAGSRRPVHPLLPARRRRTPAPAQSGPMAALPGDPARGRPDRRRRGARRIRNPPGGLGMARLRRRRRCGRRLVALPARKALARRRAIQ